MPEDSPPDWGADPLTRFMDSARDNTYATFVHLRPAINALNEVDGTFVEALQTAPFPARLEVPGMLMLKALSNLRAGASLASAGQISEAYALVRSMLENALYALAMTRDAALVQIWTNRERSPEERRACRQRFAFVRLVEDHLASCDDDVRNNFIELYEAAIDRGAHPNVSAVDGIKVAQGDKRYLRTVILLSGDPDRIRPALHDVLTAGVISLKLWIAALRPA